ncbi:MAG: SDR family oxidoreductase [Candidatus Margulisbacteria bacterium]|nr:SDR family oxidoreductase [Candidatus Margulisiibacteriota bacterium]MBU1021101.1 SDR family oxidoreductase [Candidatus Margulisiibacteriota bacterium]MBU1728656.1 SDR family oxidoreductase [Candidatus Margulisiibacteriota bacterium]MBU1955107.1 SDR family oxidoreductase [Candidatus Margulisiibacteriota bacterium]
MKNEIVLVTGGAGYIGAVLVQELLAQGKKVRVFDKLYFGDAPLASFKDKIDLVQGDVRAFPEKALEGVGAVVHLGSLSNDPTADFDPQANHAINFEGTMRVAEACKKKGVKRLSFASSCAIYGFHLEDIADENFPPNPQSEYAQSKLDAENGLKSLISNDFCPVIFRQATVFGFSPRHRWDLVVNTMTKDAFQKGIIQVYCAGDMWRPLVHVKDVALAHINAIAAPENKVKGEIFNLVYENHHILELGHMIKDILKTKRAVKVDVQTGTKESRSYRVSGDKLKQKLGFTAALSIEAAVNEIWGLLSSGRYTDFSNPIYYNIDWMKLLVDMEQKLKITGKVF